MLLVRTFRNVYYRRTFMSHVHLLLVYYSVFNACYISVIVNTRVVFVVLLDYNRMWIINGSARCSQGRLYPKWSKWWIDGRIMRLHSTDQWCLAWLRVKFRLAVVLRIRIKRVFDYWGAKRKINGVAWRGFVRAVNFFCQLFLIKWCLLFWMCDLVARTH